MNRIEELIQQLCPEGVAVKEINEICTNITSGGTPLTSNTAFYGGDIPWLRTQEVDWKDIFDTSIKITTEGLENSSAKIIPSNCVIVAMYGATAAKVAINKIPLSTNQACCNLQVDESKAHYKYVYYWLSSQYRQLKALGEGSQSNINGQKVKKFPIPIPPLPIQHEIVNILDKFTRLEAELEAELEARKKQYEFYRNQLLCFEGKEVEWRMLGEVVKISNGKDHKHLEEGNIPVYGSGGIMRHANKHMYDEESVLIPRKGSIGNVFYVDIPFWTVDTIFYTKINYEIIKPKFLFYFLKTKNLEELNFAGGVPSLTKTILDKILIPVPPLSEQNRIVEILDRFDALVNDISVGLPAEIEARRKQYEYYRGKLLHFKKLDYKEQLLSYCRYYKGEKKCPKSIEDNGTANIWHYEKMWVERSELRDEKEYNSTEYLHYGLKDFEANDGTPLTLKALLFNRYCHWSGGYGIDDDIKNFKEWYLNSYIRKAEPQ